MTRRDAVETCPLSVPALIRRKSTSVRQCLDIRHPNQRAFYPALYVAVGSLGVNSTA
jgi:hypothetical protein